LDCHKKRRSNGQQQEQIAVVFVAFVEAHRPKDEHAEGFDDAEQHHGQACQLQQRQPVQEPQTVAEPPQHIGLSPLRACTCQSFALPSDDTRSIISLAAITSRNLFDLHHFF